ncbi:hypothetical protein FOA52_012176 [Chlamydomonas sp. UWO 241]|nr:hypothetical protein FOA52_012176 [Chlamydomonas sp. UWO 241]
MDFAVLEETDGVRMTWNVWPSSKAEAAKCVVPFAAIYTPNKRIPTMPVLPYDPVSCKHCGGVLNPYARVDFHSRVWTCPLCVSRNHFPPHYQGISEQNLPAELYASYCTVEYKLSRTAGAPPHPPTYVFLVDTALGGDELEAATAAVLQAVSSLPDYVYVVLVTFGRHVHVYELGFAECSKAYVFRGAKEYTNASILEQLGFRGGVKGAQASQRPRFLCPLSEAEFAITTALEELKRDAYQQAPNTRPERCTGTAIQVVTALLGSSLPLGSCQARIISLIGGPCTVGPGKVVGCEHTEEIRSHKDVQKDVAPHFRKSRKFYHSIATDLVAHGHTLDIFLCSLDQIGLAEMRDCVLMSGGMAVTADTFHNPTFKESLRRMFASEGEDGFLGITSNATLEVIPSKDIKVAGLLGPAASMDKTDRNSKAIAETEVGYGGTTIWKVCGMDADTSFALVFEVSGGGKGESGCGALDAGPPGSGQQQLFLQFITRYLHWSGETRCRVTTLTRRWVEGNAAAELVTGFDQEAAAVLMARMASFKMEAEEDFDATRWLDRSLIRLASRFGDYRKDDPTSFNLRPELSFFPQFMFNLRRSQFVQVFGHGPDETAGFQLQLFRVGVPDAMTMIQPQLTAFSMGGQPEPVLLDVQSILPDHILLLDAFFYVVIFHGQTVAAWRKAGYHMQEEYASFAQLLAAPQAEAKEIINRRFPVPRLVDCDYQGSQARFLLVKLNPSSTHTSTAPQSAEVINTDDVSLATFTEHLKRLAVAS